MNCIYCDSEIKIINNGNLYYSNCPMCEAEGPVLDNKEKVIMKHIECYNKINHKFHKL